MKKQQNFKKNSFKVMISFISLFLIFSLPVKSLFNYEQKENLTSKKQNVDAVSLSEIGFINGSLSENYFEETGFTQFLYSLFNKDKILKKNKNNIFKVILMDNNSNDYISTKNNIKTDFSSIVLHNFSLNINLKQKIPQSILDTLNTEHKYSIVYSQNFYDSETGDENTKVSPLSFHGDKIEEKGYQYNSNI